MSDSLFIRAVDRLNNMSMRQVSDLVADTSVSVCNLASGEVEASGSIHRFRAILIVTATNIMYGMWQNNTEEDDENSEVEHYVRVKESTMRAMSALSSDDIMKDAQAFLHIEHSVNDALDNKIYDPFKFRPKLLRLLVNALAAMIAEAPEEDIRPQLKDVVSKAALEYASQSDNQHPVRDDDVRIGNASRLVYDVASNLRAFEMEFAKDEPDMPRVIRDVASVAAVVAVLEARERYGENLTDYVDDIFELMIQMWTQALMVYGASDDSYEWKVISDHAYRASKNHINVMARELAFMPSVMGGVQALYATYLKQSDTFLLRRIAERVDEVIARYWAMQDEAGKEVH